MKRILFILTLALYTLEGGGWIENYSEEEVANCLPPVKKIVGSEVLVPLTTPYCSTNKNFKQLTKGQLDELRGCLLRGNSRIRKCIKKTTTKAELENCLSATCP